MANKNDALRRLKEDLLDLTMNAAQTPEGKRFQSWEKATTAIAEAINFEQLQSAVGSLITLTTARTGIKSNHFTTDKNTLNQTLKSAQEKIAEYRIEQAQKNWFQEKKNSKQTPSPQKISTFDRLKAFFLRKKDSANISSERIVTEAPDRRPPAELPPPPTQSDWSPTAAKQAFSAGAPDKKEPRVDFLAPQEQQGGVAYATSQEVRGQRRDTTRYTKIQHNEVEPHQDATMGDKSPSVQYTEIDHQNPGKSGEDDLYATVPNDQRRRPIQPKNESKSKGDVVYVGSDPASKQKEPEDKKEKDTPLYKTVNKKGKKKQQESKVNDDQDSSYQSPRPSPF